MLTRLKIKNIALIDENVIEFSEGLNILTGETGAGKSLIIDSLNFVLGARADRTLIKNGEEFSLVECVFTLKKLTPEIEEFFNSINSEPETTIIISRYLNISGKSEIRVNGEIVTNSMLKKLTIHLVEIHGQHAHQSLLDTKNHIVLLDNFNNNIEILKNELRSELNHLNAINKQIKEIGGNGEERARNIDLLQYQINEIENSNLKINELEDLENRKTKMLNSEKIFTNLNSAITALNSGEENADVLIKIAINSISSVAQYDETLNTSLKKLNNIYYELQDTNEILIDSLDGYEFSENELNELEERLDHIKNLFRKYGNSIDDVLNYLDNAKNKLELLINSDNELKKLNTIKNSQIKVVYSKAIELTNCRKETANDIESKIISELKDLGIKHPNFKVQFNNSYNIENIESTITQNGADDIEFMFNANLGEPLKPLSKIISGGEMSRFMLAVKTVINENEQKTFIFDEIDNGIGGEAGTIVARKLSKLSENSQVICVTHLAQIASFADRHFKIEKFEEGVSTKSATQLLDNNTKVVEIARLLGSKEGSEIGLMHAKELLNISGK